MYGLFTGSRKLKLISTTSASSPTFIQEMSFENWLIIIKNKNQDRGKLQRK
jgi:hypothetical protein